MGVTHFDGLDAVSSFAIGGTTVTLTAAEMNILHNLGLSGTGGFFDHTVTAAEVKACNHIVVPLITGKQFFPIFAAMCAAGAVTTSTHIRLVESTTGGIVLGHVAADMGDAVWVGPTGGTVDITKLNTALTVSEGIKIIDVAANSLTVTTAIRVIVAGYYI